MPSKRSQLNGRRSRREKNRRLFLNALYFFVFLLLFCLTGNAAKYFYGEKGSPREPGLFTEDEAAEPVPFPKETGEIDEAGETEKVEETEEALVQPVLSFSSVEISQGDYFSIYLRDVKENDEIVIGTDLEGEEPVFYPYQEGRAALIGVNYRTVPGEYYFQVQVFRDGSSILDEQKQISVASKKFETQHLTVTSEQQEKRTDVLWDEDRKHTTRARSITAGERLWEGEFLMPLEGRLTTAFGVIRYINGVESERHSGLDIAAPRGTPVKVANSGKVNLAMSLNVTGNTVIIDHGFNLFSAYCHMDRLLVQEGDTVQKGDIVGEVGSTGFSTGPHLHWTISIGPVFVNPWLFLEKDPLEWITARQETGSWKQQPD
jgi:murein DD-endopeptidase MepM/ murein hydrolase activator NlpD